jgi:hypothetical protein
VTNRHEWRNDQWSSKLESLDLEEQLLWKKARRMMRKPTPSTPMVTPEGLALSNSEEAEVLAQYVRSVSVGKQNRRNR